MGDPTFLDTQVTAIGHAVIATDREGRATFWNQAAERLYGWSAAEMRGQHVGDTLMSEGMREQSAEIREALLGGASWTGEWVVRQRDGRSLTVLVIAAPIQDASGAVNSIVSISTAVAPQRQAEADRVSEERYRRLVQTSPDAIVVFEAKNGIVLANAAAAALWGYASEEDMQGRHFADHFAPAVAAQVTAELIVARAAERPARFEAEIITRGGSRVPIEAHATALPGPAGGPDHVLVLLRDIRERRSFEEQLRHQALHDPLTNLPNRTLLQDRLTQYLLAAERGAAMLALLLLDLNRFKEVNDTLGHGAGDALLQEVAFRLQEALPLTDTVARLGGDEFAVILPAMSLARAVRMADKLGAMLGRPLVLGGHRIDLAASIGIVIYPTHGEDSETLLRHADVAMYAAKSAGSPYAVYSRTKDGSSPARLALLSDLRQTIAEERLVLYYQPQVDLATGQVVGVEALVRWPHPTHGLIPPVEFIPLAEQTGLIDQVTAWAFRTALRQCAAWRAAGHTLHVAVNVSARNLRDPHLHTTIAEELRAANVPPRALVVELTESALMENRAQAIPLLHQIRALGVQISVDDFGTGYSSLAYLKELPLDEVKIDRSFVRALGQGGQVIMRSVVELGRNLGLRVTVEGVEDQETWNVVARLGCDVAQGYYRSRPLPAEDVAPWLAAFAQRAVLPTAPRILVVDDNPVYLELLDALFSSEGYTVDTAMTVAEAVTAFQTTPPDLVVTDIQLPDRSGFALTQDLRANPRGATLPILAITSVATTEGAQEAAQAGCTLYLEKPSSHSDLVHLVTLHLALATP